MGLGKVEIPKLEPKGVKKLPTFSERTEEALIKSLFEEQNSEEKEDVREEVLNAKTSIHKARPDEEWDVPLDEEIQYFDPELSYELTGYRPITMQKGLDFDPAPFRESAIKYETTGSYTEFPRGTKKYREFWLREIDRCRNGYTVGRYRITGDNYFYLNFYRMDILKEGANGASGRTESFPKFLSKQYEWFHYVEMAALLHKDACAFKARGVGWSEMTASMCVAPYTVRMKYKVLLTAPDSTKLTPLKNKCWFNLDWLNQHTKGGLAHPRGAVNNSDTKRASYKTPNGTEKGWMSEINSVVADSSDKIRGDRLDRLIYEEAGSSRILTENWIKGDSLVSLGGVHFGQKIALGTAGDDVAIDGLRTMFLNPNGYNILPFKNYDSDDGRPEITSFFLPAHKFALTSEYLDARGVTNWPKLKKRYEELRAKLSDKDYLTECAEHCFCPREGLSKHGDNVFDAAAITERIVQMRVDGNVVKPTKMQLLWDVSGGEVQMNRVKAVESKNSHLLVWEPPLIDPETNKPYKNLYVAGIDAIDMGRNDSVERDVSDFCVLIKRRVFGLKEPKYVAMYKYRPNDIREAYDLTMKLLTWYDCKAMLEYTKISIQTYFREKGKDYLFMKRPDFAISAATKKSQSTKKLIGVPTTTAVINHQLELISSYVNDYWYTIDSEEMLDQLLNYTVENKRKFDIIAAMAMVELGDEDMSGTVVGKVNTIKKQWKDIGWYRDTDGRKKYGVIPDGQIQTRANWSNWANDWKPVYGENWG